MTTATSDINTRIKELTTALEQKSQRLNAISNTITDETGKGHMVISPEAHADYQKTLGEAREIKALLLEQKEHRDIERFLDEPNEPSYAAHDAAAVAHGKQYKSLSEAFLGSDAYAEMKSGSFRQLGQVAEFEQGLYSFERKDIFSLSAGTHTTPAFGTAENVGLAERQRRPGRVRDLFPSEQTQSNILYGIRQIGFTNNARRVPEREQPNGGPALGNDTDVFGKAPKSKLSFIPYTAPIVELAHTVHIHKNTLADESRIRGIIDRDLVDGLKLKEDEEILYGAGNGDEITGLFNIPGAQEYTGLVADAKYKSLQLRRSATMAILAFFEPNGVVLHPFDWEEIETERDEHGQYLIAVSIAVGGEKRVWRMRVVDTAAITQGTFLTCSFGYGAKLFDREAVSVQASTETGEAFERGYVVLRGSERIGLAVDRPESLVLGTFAPAP
ncbi:phage major capsid protein [Nonomuraea sp. NPDC050394]|uniref:phage major capsid protein n=1 Tax=Nonomuraea sp. NPDC050394 TaxID=3364363 RepID=UPI0037A4BD9F